MNTSDFDYELPEERIAQTPAEVRDKCRMLVMDRATGALSDKIFSDVLDYLRPGDLLVANETRVLPARLLGRKRGTGGEAEILLLRELIEHRSADGKTAQWEALVRPGKRLKPGSGAIVDFTDAQGSVVLSASVVDWAASGTSGERIVELTTPLVSFDEALHAIGRAPLPPYIHDYTGDAEMYQTVYSNRETSAAAPTAGLHFTRELIEAARARGVNWATVELEVGLDTFRIVDEEHPEDHKMHTERYTVPPETVAAIEQTKAAGRRVIAVGTTSVRSLESAAVATEAKYAEGEEGGADVRPLLEAQDRASTSLFILPGYKFAVVDGLITNFHVPKSTLMMLVSAFSSRENIMAAYQHAIEKEYRFLSFGDAMLII
jgi:S-adenosylmethionine:tRNA ribosyltransferase-isomerase